MKPHLATLLRCSECGGRFALDATDRVAIDRPLPGRLPACSGLCGHPVDGCCASCARIEVVSGTLTCQRCAQRRTVADGVPWMAPQELLEDRTKTRTASSFGHLWAQSAPTLEAAPRDYHFEKMMQALKVGSPDRGLVLDGGCGDGIDLCNRARAAGAEVVGAELSAGGCRTTARRIVALPNAHVVQADLTKLPFEDRAFDFVYSYGVLHHLPVPDAGLRELARVARHGASVVLYLYEDFSDRSLAWRASLALANAPRTVTTRLPHGLLYALCQVASPFIYAGFTVPHRILTRVPLSPVQSFAGRVPFRHGTGPFSLTGDLYDRFSAPVEFRYSREGTRQFVERAGLTVRAIERERGWMALAEQRAGGGARERQTTEHTHAG